MNSSFGVVDGKPVVVRHEHVNLGLAIDVAEARRHAHAARAERQGRRHARLRRLPRRVRRPRSARSRDEQALARRLRRHDRVDHQPGHDRHRALGAAAHAGPGLHRRRRRDRLPGRVRGRRPADARRARRRARSSRSRAPTTTASSRAPRAASSSRAIHELLLGERRASTTTIFASLGVPYEPARWYAGPQRASPTRSTQHEKVVHGPRSSSTCTACAATSSRTSTRSGSTRAATPTPSSTSTTTGLTIWDLDREFPIGSLGAGRLAAR